MQEQPHPTEEVIYLPHTMLQTHSRNMRRCYPQRDVERMAESIRARGVLEPLIGTRNDGHVEIVIGNLRLAAARHLGDEAPLMPVIVRERRETEQLLDMVAENLVRAAPDPVSEGFHYRRILQEPGMTRTRLARETGVAIATINERLRLLDLDPEIQDLVAAGQLPHGREPVEALLSISDSTARVETARALAQRRADVRLIKAACTRMRGAIERRLKIQERNRRGVEYVPALEAALEEGLPPDEQAVSWDSLRAAAWQACERCKEAARDDDAEIRPLKQAREPAWSVFAKRECPIAAEPTWQALALTTEGACTVCSLRDVGDFCGTCPLVEFLQRVVRQMERARREEVARWE
jgi:ParB/RepB/Spo0J family partition protein